LAVRYYILPSFIGLTEITFEIKKAPLKTEVLRGAVAFLGIH
jgi:hypothetical protein